MQPIQPNDLATLSGGFRREKYTGFLPLRRWAVAIAIPAFRAKKFTGGFALGGDLR